MQARSALFDLYGDYLRPRGGRAPIAALVRLLAPLGVAAPAVRTAVSRMVRQGWLLPIRLTGGPGYQLTVKAVHRLDDAAARIYRTGRLGWDGHFDLVVLTPPERRADRARLTAALAYHGYGSLDAATWVAPRPSDDVDSLLKESGVPYERFTAAHAAGMAGAAALVRRAWDLDALAEAYRQFMTDLEPIVTRVSGHGPNGSPIDGSGDRHAESGYAARFRLVHAWRTFLFRDPQLPPALLPEAWPGRAAAEFFDRHEARLRPVADLFVEQCLTQSKGPFTLTGGSTGGPTGASTTRPRPKRPSPAKGSR
jgi:phenylacetic acid degradation operon negative regulatory protein